MNRFQQNELERQRKPVILLCRAQKNASPFERATASQTLYRLRRFFMLKKHLALSASQSPLCFVGMVMPTSARSLAPPFPHKTRFCGGPNSCSAFSKRSGLRFEARLCRVYGSQTPLKSKSDVQKLSVRFFIIALLLRKVNCRKAAREATLGCLLRKGSRLLRLFACKRAHNASAALPTLFGVPPAAAWVEQISVHKAAAKPTRFSRLQHTKTAFLQLRFALQKAVFCAAKCLFSRLKTQLLPAAKPAFSVLKRGIFRGLKQRFLPSEMRLSAPIRQPENAFERVLFGVQCFVCGFCKK